MQRLSAKSVLPASVNLPNYKAEDHGVGIVHLGLGAFHRAHQAVYTDGALAYSGGDWRILGVSLRSDAVAQTLRPQDGRYLLLEQGIGLPKDGELRLIASIADAKSLKHDRQAIVDALCAQETKIVSLTITEKAYFIDRENGNMMLQQPSVIHDLKNPEDPETAVGLIVLALSFRRKNGVEPFTVLCCDNLPNNGALVRAGVVDYAARIDPALSQWVADNVAFPSTMVDRITPAMTPTILDFVSDKVGFEDQAAVVTESFSQWVIEDHFPTGRPAWDKAEAVFVNDVEPFEKMKLRMLNGSHSLLAYAGFLADCETVSDAMAFEPIRALVKAHLKETSLALQTVSQIDYDKYAIELCERFENPKLEHATYQIAMDGTEKLPQRLLEAAVQTAETNGELQTYIIAVALWMRYCLGVKESGETYELRDPRQKEIEQKLLTVISDTDRVRVLFELPNLFPKELTSNVVFTQGVTKAFVSIQSLGTRASLEFFHQELG